MVTETQARSDSSVRDDVQYELKWDPKISSNDIAVSLKDGVVTLAGFVPSYWEKLEAENAAKRVNGVRGVANDIEVKLFWQRSDPEIARAAVELLENSVSVPGDKIKVTVKNGELILEGTVDWQYQKYLAEEAVKKLKGVTWVTNKIEVKPQISPAGVKGKIEEALRRSAELDASSVTVEAEGSTVKLYGSVSSWAERDEAERVAWSAPGATEVENHITIAPEY